MHSMCPKHNSIYIYIYRLKQVEKSRLQKQLEGKKIGNKHTKLNKQDMLALP